MDKNICDIDLGRIFRVTRTKADDPNLSKINASGISPYMFDSFQIVELTSEQCHRIFFELCNISYIILTNACVNNSDNEFECFKYVEIFLRHVWPPAVPNPLLTHQKYRLEHHWELLNAWLQFWGITSSYSIWFILLKRLRRNIKFALEAEKEKERTIVLSRLLLTNLSYMIRICRRAYLFNSHKIERLCWRK